MTKSRIYALIKIFEQEGHADAFIQEGLLRCGTLGEFKCIEDGARGDEYEGVTDWHQPDGITIKITFKDEDGVEKTIPIEELAGPVIIQNRSYDRLNLYCMYAIKIPEFVETFETAEERVVVFEKINAMLKECSVLSDDVLKLGAFAVVVYKVEDFIAKVKVGTGEDRIACWNGLVGYYDPDKFHGSFEGVVSAFRKRNIYAYQNEYRFCFQSQDAEGERFLHLGSLDGMAFKASTKDLNQMFQIALAE